MAGNTVSAMTFAGDLPFEVVAAEAATPSIRRLWLRPLDGALEFRPGQYVQLADAGRSRPPRAYSLANAPRPDGRLSLLVARVTGGTTSAWVHDGLDVGDEVAVSGPFGVFVDDRSATAPALYLASGAGFAPVRALLEEALAARRRAALTLVFSARTEADVIDGDLLRTWQREDPSFRFVRTLTRERGEPPRGRIPDLLPTVAPQLAESDVFIAGSPDFARSCVAAVRSLGVPPARLHTEVFYLEPQPWEDTVPIVDRLDRTP